MNKIASLTALAAVMSAAGKELEFPATVHLHNNNWAMSVEPETSTAVPPMATVPVVVQDVDQFTRLLSNLEQLAAVNEWPEGAGLFLVDPTPPGPPAEELAAAAQAEADVAAAKAAADAAAAAAAAEAEAEAEAKAAADKEAAEKAAADAVAAKAATPAKPAKK